MAKYDERVGTGSDSDGFIMSESGAIATGFFSDSDRILQR